MHYSHQDCFFEQSVSGLNSILHHLVILVLSQTRTDLTKQHGKSISISYFMLALLFREQSQKNRTELLAFHASQIIEYNGNRYSWLFCILAWKSKLECTKDGGIKSPENSIKLLMHGTEKKDEGNSFALTAASKLTFCMIPCSRKSKRSYIGSRGDAWCTEAIWCLFSSKFQWNDV